MYTTSDTKQYSVNPKEMINGAFNRSYSRFADTQKELPPDTVTMVCSVVSMVLLVAMFLLTAFRHPAEKAIWFAFSAATVGVIGFIIYKYMKTRSAYLKAAGKPDLINARRSEFLALFGETAEQTEPMLAVDLQDQVRRLKDREQDEVRKSALKDMFDRLTKINNPDLPVCRLVTKLNERFTQSRARLYMKKEGNSFIFFDCNWSNPLGQIECGEDDILSYGKFSAYPPAINTSGSKIRPESGILEIAGDNGSIYLDFVDDEYEKALKVLPRRKEK
ncbi:MAG: hypothetical protein J6V14_02835 [Clostridia bacterium]|nr:hypothetical protein [Clostridia bacterium]